MLQQAQREGKIAYFSHTKLIIKNSFKPSSTSTTASSTEGAVGGAHDLATSGTSTVGPTQRGSGKASATAPAAGTAPTTSTAATTFTATSASSLAGFTSGVKKTANESTARRSTRTKF